MDNQSSPVSIESLDRLYCSILFRIYCSDVAPFFCSNELQAKLAGSSVK
jgi:hypothetical protein